MPKTELTLQSPLMNAAGILGFSPDLKNSPDLSQLGAFVTHPVSWEPRTPARGDRFLPYPGGFLLHTGYPNPGLRAVIRHHKPRWARSPIPVIVHLLAGDAYTVERMVRRLEGIDGVIAVEIGLPPEIDSASAAAMALAALGELSVIIRVPFEASADLVAALTSTGINALSLAPQRGLLPGLGGSLVSGRLYGPALLPQSFARVTELCQFGIPIIGGGGIYTQEEAEVFLSAGAIAVQLDSVLWRGGFFQKGEG